MSAYARIIINALVITLAFAASYGVYDRMPDEMASHWDANDNVNGSMSKNWGLFLVPVIMLMFGLFLFLSRKVEVIWREISVIWDRLLNFSVVLQVFLFGVHLHVILYNLGIVLSTSKVIGFLLGLLFASLSPLLRDIPRNRFMGFRTPWTLKDDRVWKITHEKAATYYRWIGLMLIIAPFISNTAVWGSIAMVFLSSIYLLVDSYIISLRFKD